MLYHSPSNLRSARGGYTLKYQFVVNDTLYKNMTARKINKCKFESTFKGKYFPVVYSTKNPEKSILIAYTR